MKLLTEEIKAQLIHNNVMAREFDHVPVVKFFLPGTGCTWVLTEMEPDGACFGLCDLGHGEPELGYVRVDELESIKGPAGLTVERDLHFRTDRPLSIWTVHARINRCIVDPDHA